MESRFPVLVERYALNVEAGGGAGRHRGGFGFVREYRILDAREAAGYGSIGGWLASRGRSAAGARHQNFLEYAERRAPRPPWPGRRRSARPRRRRRLVTGTGGGYGDPFERDPERVREDVLDGYVTIEQRAPSTGSCSSRGRSSVEAATREAAGA